MWYFSWALGVGLALAFGVLNAMWFEMTELSDAQPAGGQAAAVSAGSVTMNTEPLGRLGP